MLTPHTDTDKYLVSFLDIDTIIIISKINKSLNHIVKQIPIYQQLLSYVNQNKYNMFEFLCVNDHADLLFYLDKYGYKFEHLHVGKNRIRGTKILNWYNRFKTNLCKFATDMTSNKCPYDSPDHNDYGYAICKYYECAYSEYDHNFGDYEKYKTENKLGLAKYLKITKPKSTITKNDDDYSNSFYFYELYHCYQSGYYPGELLDYEYHTYRKNYGNDQDDISFCYDSKILSMIKKLDTKIEIKYYIGCD